MERKLEDPKDQKKIDREVEEFCDTLEYLMDQHDLVLINSGVFFGENHRRNKERYAKAEKRQRS